MTRRSFLIRYQSEPLNASNDNPSGLFSLDLNSYWHGGIAPKSRSTRLRAWWNFDYFEVVFDYEVLEPLVINSIPDRGQKTIGLWERDVCEIFVAPDKVEPRRYFEFEVAPTGEWLDLAIDLTSGERVTDWDYNSGMEAAAKIEEGRVLMAMKIPWKAFGRMPKAGDVWLGNIFRCVGEGENRGYLAWQPTMTEKPNFHVPEKFGEFEFVK